MNDVKKRILDYITINGPVLPVQISKQIGTNILMAGALLSELVSDKKLIISNTKRGGSPFYYIKGQEYKLQNIADNLSGKEKEAYNLLREKRVIRDISAEPWQRVALRSISDFAVPIMVQTSDREEIFWKWFLIENNDLKELVGVELQGYKEEIKKEGIIEARDTLIQRDEVKQVIEKKVDEQQSVLFTEKKKIEREKTQVERERKEFYEMVIDYFRLNKIEILEQKIIKKGKEYIYLIDIPSKIGKLRYLAFVKNKKKINESDLKSAYGESQQKKLSALFLTNGELSKKSHKYLDNELKNQLIFKRLGDND